MPYFSNQSPCALLKLLVLSTSVFTMSVFAGSNESFRTPSGLFPLASQRESWMPMIELNREQWIRNAEAQLTMPLPEWSEELYLEYSRNGEREGFQRLRSEREKRFFRLFFGELAENKGRFIPALEQVMESLVVEKSWILPAHDGTLQAFHGEIRQIDLGSAMRSFDLAMVTDVFAEKLDPELIKATHDAIRERTLEPYLGVVESGKLPAWYWWMETTNNWNSVCHFGVIGAGLIIERDAEVRRKLLEGMQQYLPSYLEGFGADGYCEEGLGYWNYGFAQYAALAELVRRATDGNIDLLDNGEIEPIALYPFRLQLAPGRYPTFADGDLETRPQGSLTAYLSRRFPALQPFVENPDEAIADGGHISILCFGFSQSAGPVTQAPNAEVDPLRSLFADGGVVVSRSGEVARTSAALKAGHNGEHHNHNDVGSFVVAVDGIPLIVDPGKEIYRQRTFGPNRYESKVLNSFGHPVPVVAGRLQAVGEAYHGTILSTEFGEISDRARIDIAAAYPVPTLKRLERELLHSREDGGLVTVMDDVAFSTDEAFSETLITFGSFRQTAVSRGIISQDDCSLEVSWESTSGGVTVVTERIEERLPRGLVPLRIEFVVDDPVVKATFTFHFRPL